MQGHIQGYGLECPEKPTPSLAEMAPFWSRVTLPKIIP